ncbi:MAG: site-2 protease family protein [Candidatus Algichlamydia australiensis]|nr:site-2 protease family protein [Chlamydiales bacterium]
MNFKLPGNIPVRVSFGFWVTAAIIGVLYSFNVVGTLIWMAIIFISILVHEFGHAIASLIFGQHPRIELIPFGGLTYPEGKKISKFKEFLVIFNGPFFGILLFAISYAILKIPAVENSFWKGPLLVMRNVNLFWTLVNLLPVLPLDGGQLMRVIFESIFKNKGIKIALIASICISISFILTSFLIGYFLIGAIFALFAFQNFETYRHMRSFDESDRDEENQELIRKAEEALANDHKPVAKPLLEKIIKKTSRGMIFNAASQYLAKILYDEGDEKRSYELLIRVHRDLPFEGKLLLHELAFKNGNDQMTLQLAGECFQETQNAEVALRSAKAAARLKQVEPAIGWLQAAERAGLKNIETHLKEKDFDSIRNHPNLNLS